MRKSFWEDTGPRGMTAKAVVSPTGAIIARNHSKKAPLHDGDVGIEIRVDRKKVDEITPEQRVGMQSIAGAMADHLMTHVGVSKEQSMWEIGTVVHLTFGNSSSRGVVQRVTDTHIRIAVFSDELYVGQKELRVLMRDFPLSLTAICEVDRRLDSVEGMTALALLCFLESPDELHLPYLFKDEDALVYALRNVGDHRVKARYFVDKCVDLIDPKHYVELIASAWDVRFMEFIPRASLEQLCQIALLEDTNNEHQKKARVKYRSAAIMKIVDTGVAPVEPKAFQPEFSSGELSVVWDGLDERRREILVDLFKSASPASHLAAAYLFDAEVLVETLEKHINEDSYRYFAGVVYKNIGYLMSVGDIPMDSFTIEQMHRIWECVCRSSKENFIRRLEDRSLIEFFIGTMNKTNDFRTVLTQRWHELSDDIPKPEEDGSFIFRDTDGNWQGPFTSADITTEFIESGAMDEWSLFLEKDSFIQPFKYSSHYADD